MDSVWTRPCIETYSTQFSIVALIALHVTLNSLKAWLRSTATDIVMDKVKVLDAATVSFDTS